jgi:hypothetical protein
VVNDMVKPYAGRYNTMLHEIKVQSVLLKKFLLDMKTRPQILKLIDWHDLLPCLVLGISYGSYSYVSQTILLINSDNFTIKNELKKHTPSDP